jgi:hypothetical protein
MTDGCEIVDPGAGLGDCEEERVAGGAVGRETGCVFAETGSNPLIRGGMKPELVTSRLPHNGRAAPHLREAVGREQPFIHSHAAVVDWALKNVARCSWTFKLAATIKNRSPRLLSAQARNGGENLLPSIF